ncbi:glycerol channel [Basidiobolus ranarum]|uniref:Glycerol channel n=1 Tax=Basidiobolus ranarum TaxID=34480 RepID=A0ABR2WTN3_9FUNG
MTVHMDMERVADMEVQYVQPIEQNIQQPMLKFAQPVASVINIDTPNGAEIKDSLLVTTVEPQSHHGWSRLETARNQVCAEFIGTFLLMFFSYAGNAQSILYKSPFAILAAPLGLAAGLYVSGGVSFFSSNDSSYLLLFQKGGHLNPAITVSFAIHRKFPWRKVPRYIGAQLLGAFFAALFAFLYYWPDINHYDQGLHRVTGELATAGIFAFNPPGYYSNLAGFFKEVLNDLVFLLGIYGITDVKNGQANGYVVLGVSFHFLAVLVCFGGNAINPAGDFCGRAVAAMVGYGSEMFSANNCYFWITFTGPFLGAALGGLLYRLFIHPKAESVVMK